MTVKGKQSCNIAIPVPEERKSRSENWRPITLTNCIDSLKSGELLNILNPLKRNFIEKMVQFHRAKVVVQKYIRLLRA
jgi:hypothetical protein